MLIQFPLWGKLIWPEPLIQITPSWMRNGYDQTRILLTGATGFVGRRLFALLQDNFVSVRCATRSAARATRHFPERSWVQLDVDQPQTLAPALADIDVAYYLVHGMSDHGDYEAKERMAAERFAHAAAQQGVRRIVYLGGVAPSGEVSAHLRSRITTGEILRSGSVPCIELRAGMIIGHGSTSWQMVRDLSARLPVMVLPSWLKTKSQPVAINDVLHALVHAARVSTDESTCYSVPGPEVLSAKEILLRVSRLRGYRQITIDVPFVSPRLSSYWIQWVTRANYKVARELVEGLRSDLVATKPPFWDILSEYSLMPFDEAARRALKEDHKELSLKAKALEAVVQRVAPKR